MEIERRPRRALITGASGYIGSRLAQRLVACGWDVHVLVRASSHLGLLAPVLQSITVHRIGDDADELSEAMRRAAPDAVFHLAAVYVAEHRASDITALVEANLLFSTRLLEAMRLHGVCLLLNTGTAWQHFQGRDYDPVNLYAATKQAFEAILAYYVNAHGLRAATLLLFDTYGPQDPRPKLVNALWRALAGGTPLAMSTGDELIDLVHVDDVAEAFLAAEAALRSAAPAHLRYGVSSGRPLRLREVVAAFEEATGGQLDVQWGARPSRARDVLVPWTGFAAPPGWTPHVRLADGIRECAPGGLAAR
jgi:nucleoside-diphosphate-sugar epimerase